MPRAMDIMDFMEGIQSIKENHMDSIQGLSLNRQTTRIFEIAEESSYLEEDDEDEPGGFAAGRFSVNSQ